LEHLYRNGAAKYEKREFEKRYGKKKGDYVYGATVGKVKREREGKRCLNCGKIYYHKHPYYCSYKCAYEHTRRRKSYGEHLLGIHRML